MSALSGDTHLRGDMGRRPTSRADPAHQLNAGVERQTSISVGRGDLRLSWLTSQSPPHPEVSITSSRRAVNNVLAGYT